MKPKETALAAVVTTVGYIVLKGGRPCGLVNVSGLHRGGVLIAQTSDTQPAIFFLKRRDARRAISRTERCVNGLRGSMIEDWAWDKCPTLFATGEFTIVPAGRQS